MEEEARRRKEEEEEARRRREVEEEARRKQEEEDRWVESELARGRDAVARATSIMAEQIASADAIVSRPRKRKEPVEEEEDDDEEEEEEEEEEPEAGPSALPMVRFFFYFICAFTYRLF